jgi:hypothetical protein
LTDGKAERKRRPVKAGKAGQKRSRRENAEDGWK